MTDTAVRIAELEADNGRLRRLLDQQDASGELRHRLRNTLAMLRTIIRRSADTKRDVDSYVAQLEDRVDALARAQAAIDNNGWIDLHGLLADELQSYAAPEGERVSFSGPIIRLLGRAGQVFGLAIHELAVNAVEHGALGGTAGRIEIVWTLSDDPQPVFQFTWKETGLSGLERPAEQGFGTEILTRTLRYEMKAETQFAFDAAGFTCVIRFPFSNAIGLHAEN